METPFLNSFGRFWRNDCDPHCDPDCEYVANRRLSITRTEVAHSEVAHCFAEFGRGPPRSSYGRERILPLMPEPEVLARRSGRMAVSG
jgi:hypothetical protein